MGGFRTVTYHLLFLFYGIRILRKVQRGDSLHIVPMMTVIIVIVVIVLVLACLGSLLRRAQGCLWRMRSQRVQVKAEADRSENQVHMHLCMAEHSGATRLFQK